MSGLQDQTVVVLGGHGFVGSHLVETAAAAGGRVRVLCARDADGGLGCLEYVDPVTRGVLDVRVGSPGDADVLVGILDGADVVFYAYACYPSVPDAPWIGGDEHVSAAHALSVAARQQRIGKLVWTATGDYGRPAPWAGPTRPEVGPSLPSLLSAELVLRGEASRGAPIARLAACTVYGPRQPSDALIPAMLHQLAVWARPVVVPGPVPRQEYLYVDDFVAALIAAAHASSAGYQPRTGVPLSVGQVFAACCQAVGTQTALDYAGVPLGPPMDEIDDELRALADTCYLPGWAPATALEEGVRRTVAALAPDRPPGVSWFA